MRVDLSAVTLWLVVPALLVVGVLLVRQTQITRRARVRVSALETELRARDEELHHLVTQRLPALRESLHERPVEVPGPRYPHLGSDSAYGQALDGVLRVFAESVEATMKRADDSAKFTLKAMMRTVQSLANEQQLAISGMQERHDDPDVLEGLLHIDHMNSQLGRRAQAAAVLCGSWPGQQRSASSLTDVVRGATSRIRDYLRVQVNTQVDTAVVSRAVEPVVLAVAEVLDNGARHSQPNTTVEVDFRPAHNGMAIVVDDAGVGMNADELREAETFLTGQRAVNIHRLGDPPQVGFPVIGVLAARYGFSVSVDTRSPYGGVRAVVFLPNALLTRTTPESTSAAPVSTDEQPTKSTTSSGLPKRRRRQPAAEHSAPTTGETPTAPPRRTGTPTTISAWQRGTLYGRASTPAEEEGTPEG